MGASVRASVRHALSCGYDIDYGFRWITFEFSILSCFGHPSLFNF